MPKKDRTFSEKDVFRIFERYLTQNEQEKVLEYFAEELKVEIDRWPESLCYYLGEIVELISFAISLSVQIWAMSSLMRKIVDFILDSAKFASLVPILGPLILRDVEQIHFKITQFHVDTAKRLDYLQEYFDTFLKYINEKCWKR